MNQACNGTDQQHKASKIVLNLSVYITHNISERLRHKYHIEGERVVICTRSRWSGSRCRYVNISVWYENKNWRQNNRLSYLYSFLLCSKLPCCKVRSFLFTGTLNGLLWCRHEFCWYRCPCFSASTLRREAKPESVHECDICSEVLPLIVMSYIHLHVLYVAKPLYYRAIPFIHKHFVCRCSVDARSYQAQRRHDKFSAIFRYLYFCEKVPITYSVPCLWFLMLCTISSHNSDRKCKQTPIIQSCSDYQWCRILFTDNTI